MIGSFLWLSVIEKQNAKLQTVENVIPHYMFTTFIQRSEIKLGVVDSEKVSTAKICSAQSPPRIPQCCLLHMV